MMRPATLVLLGLAGVAGATLFSVSYDVSELETRLATLNRQIVDDQEATHVLRAEWSFLNQPARLEELSGRYLDLQPLTGAQIATADALPVRLPVPDAAADDTDAAESSESKTALATLTEELAGPHPLFKPLPPVRPASHRATAPMRRAPAPAAARIVPVSARSLNDVLADLTGPEGRR